MTNDIDQLGSDEPWTGDGMRDTGRTAQPYEPGSLRVLHDGIDISDKITETDPGTGKYALRYMPAEGSKIRHKYQQAGVQAAVEAMAQRIGATVQPMLDRMQEQMSRVLADRQEAFRPQLESISASLSQRVADLPRLSDVSVTNPFASSIDTAELEAMIRRVIREELANDRQSRGG